MPVKFVSRAKTSNKKYSGARKTVAPSKQPMVLNYRKNSLVAATPMGASKKCDFKYCETFQLTSGIGGVGGVEQVFRLNSLFDPNFTGVGHQPYMWDQMAQIYSTYNVTAVSIVVDWFSMAGPNNCGVMALQASTGAFSTAGKTLDSLKEKPGTLIAYPRYAGSGHNTCNLGRIELSDLEGCNPERIQNDDRFSAGVSANPDNTPYLRLNAADGTGTGEAGLWCTVTIIYHTRLYDRKTLAQS